MSKKNSLLGCMEMLKCQFTGYLLRFPPTNTIHAKNDNNHSFLQNFALKRKQNNFNTMVVELWSSMYDHFS